VVDQLGLTGYPASFVQIVHVTIYNVIKPPTTQYHIHGGRVRMLALQMQIKTCELGAATHRCPAVPSPQQHHSMLESDDVRYAGAAW
jgi:hypothetical protein